MYVCMCVRVESGGDDVGTTQRMQTAPGFRTRAFNQRFTQAAVKADLARSREPIQLGRDARTNGGTLRSFKVFEILPKAQLESGESSNESGVRSGGRRAVIYGALKQKPGVGLTARCRRCSA